MYIKEHINVYFTLMWTLIYYINVDINVYDTNVNVHINVNAYRWQGVYRGIAEVVVF